MNKKFTLITNMTRLLALIFLFSLSIQSWAVSSSDYSSLNGKSGSTLWDAVHSRAKSGYSTLSYAGLWTAYKTTDVYPTGHANAGKIWDMYGGCSFTYSSDQCGSYSGECSCYNREHSIPKSWFGGSEGSNSPGTDIFHVVPTDGKVNGMRSNYAFGEVNSATYSYNGSKLGSAKSITIENTMLGTSVTKSCSSSPVFEPIDEYKGDFARGYLGTLLRWNSDYQAFTSGDGSSIFSGTYTEAGHWGLTEYGIALLLKWHRQDPVSQKEIDRNNGIESTQGNRNPFIDYPILAEYIWGKYAGNSFNTSNAVGSFESAFTPGVSDGDKSSTTPTLAVSATSITMDPVAVNGTSTATFTVTGANLTSTISISVSGSYYSVSPTTITAANANKTNTITVTYHPTATGTHNGTITISSSGATSKSVSVSGTCTTVYTATWLANGSNFHSNTAASGTSPSMPSDTPDDCSGGKVFVGWTAQNSVNGDAPSDLFTSSAPAITANTTFRAVYATATTVSGGGTVNDTINNAKTTSSLGGTATSTWVSEFTITGNTGAKYTIRSMGINGATDYAMQWNANGYLYCSQLPTNGGKLKSVTVTAKATKNVTIYGNSTAYTAKATATSCGTLSASTSGATYTFDTDYYGIGVNGAASSTQIVSIIISYDGGSSTTYSDYSTSCSSSSCTPVAATASFASSSKTATCGGSVSNTFTTNSDATPTFTSSNTSVATVDNSGAVTVVGQGSTTITGSVAATTCFTGGASASYTLTVNRTTTTATFNSPTTTLNKGASATNVVTTNSDATVTYTSSNPSVATVNSNGKVTAVGAGTTTITATIPQNSCYTSKTATYTLTVYDFQATAATNVTSSSFTANWTSAGANSYSLDVYYGTISSTTENRDTTWVSESFDSNQGDFTIENVSIGGLSYVWSRKTYNNNGYMNGSAYVSNTNNAAESWLLSPEIDLTNATSVTVSFEGAAKYQNGTLSDEITLWIAEEPSSTFNSSEWTQITIPTYPTTGSWTFVSTGNIDITAYKDKKIKLAVKYLSTSSAADTYELDNFLVTGKYNKITNTSSITHVTGYPKSVTGTSASVTGLNASTTYYYTVTPNGGSESNVIEVTTSEEACSATLTVQYEDTQGTGAIQ
ncbi:MAG: endonuclease [Paludibacteraceae bacterium]|nr:endonuclease [Paludibacteraceae bacterium]